jgi:hypothetical protein
LLKDITFIESSVNLLDARVGRLGSSLPVHEASESPLSLAD